MALPVPILLIAFCALCQSKWSAGEAQPGPQRRFSLIKPTAAPSLPSSALLPVIKPMKKWRSSVCRLAIDGPRSCAPPPPLHYLTPTPPHPISKLVRPDAWPALARMQMMRRRRRRRRLYLNPNKRSCGTSRLPAPDRAALSRRGCD